MDLNLDGSSLFAALALHQLAQALTQNDDHDEDEPRIRDITDEEPTTTNSSISTMAQLLRLEAKSSAYLEQGKYEEAYGMVKKLYKLGPSVSFAPVLIKYFVCLLQTDRGHKAEKIRNDLTSLLKDNMEITAADAAKYGDSVRSEKRYFEAILFYQIAADLSEDEFNPAEVTDTAQRCTLGTKLSVTSLLEDQKVLKGLVKRHIIPYQEKSNDRLKRVKSVPKELLCMVQAMCYHHTEQCYLMVDDLKSQEAALNKGIGVLRDGLGKDVEKHELYGAFLNNLGNTYMKMDRPGNAARVLTDAIAAMKKANYDTELERRNDIQKAERVLLLARATT